MAENHETDELSQMRKSVQKLGSSTEKYGEATLKRFLIAKSMDQNKAAKMFVQWQKWRDSFVPLGFIPDSQVADELESRKLYLQGLSKQRHSVLLVKANEYFPSKDQLQFKKLVVHVLDKTIRSSFQGKETGYEKLILVIDLKKISYKNVDYRGFNTAFQTLQSYYPERLARVFLLNMPGFSVSIWKIVARFLEKATLEKFVIISSEDEMKEFVREIGEDALPEEYGGKAKLISYQDVHISPLED